MMRESLGFSKFREEMDTWDAFLAEEESEKNLKHLFDSNGLVLFFKRGKEIFGADEDSRVVFAKLKNPDEDTTDGWVEEASFTAHNLSKLVQGEPGQNVFAAEDMKKIKIIDQDKAIDSLKDEAGEDGLPQMQMIQLRIPGRRPDPDTAANPIRTDEEP